jgi:L-alanine-DL-glutamate epimerase-like enolase superfamily enzyme
MDNPRLTQIEKGYLSGIRPRNHGRNARLPEHGREVHEPFARLRFEDGSSGFGFSPVTEGEAKALLGKTLDTLVSVENGVHARARSIEFPLWDTLGQRAGQPVYRLLNPGQNAPFSAPCYDTSFYFDDFHLDDDAAGAALMAGLVREDYERGHRAFKLKIGRGALHMPLLEGTHRDIAVIQAVRTAIGPDAVLMIDANNGYNVNIAKWVLTETADCTIYWLEEPFHEDPVLYEQLQRWLRDQHLSILTADGEGQAAPDLLDWARDGLVNVIQYSLVHYGLGAWLKTGHQLDEWGVKSAPHNYASPFGNYASCHLAAALKHFAFVEWDTVNMEGLIADGYRLHEGRIEVPDTPGFGLRPDEALFEKSVKTDGFTVS